MERQDPSYGVVVHTSVLRVHGLLGGSNSPTSRSPEVVDWIICIVTTLRLGAQRWSTGLYAYELQGCKPFTLRRGVAYIEFARPL